MDTSAFSIRQASPADTTDLSHFASKAFMEAYSGTMDRDDINKYLEKSFNQAEVKKQLESPDMLFHLAFANDELAGYTKLRWDRARDELGSGRAIELERIYVGASHYRTGLGTLMLDHAISISRKKGFVVMWLAVWQKNIRAISFYKKTGFEIFGVQKFTVGTIVNDDYVFRLMLRP